MNYPGTCGHRDNQGNDTCSLAPLTGGEGGVPKCMAPGACISRNQASGRLSDRLQHPGFFKELPDTVSTSSIKWRVARSSLPGPPGLMNLHLTSGRDSPCVLGSPKQSTSWAPGRL